MELPQELIDAIVDAIVAEGGLAQDPWMIDNSVDLLETLRSCALVAHAFVRPCQTYLFHGLILTDNEGISPEALSAIFTASPHLASYARALYFEHRAVDAHLESILNILASLTNLARIDIYPSTGDVSLWATYPEPLRASFSAIFALPSIQHITLCYLWFEDASELQTLLSESTGLKTLGLCSVAFAALERGEGPKMPPAVSSPRVVLNSLQVYFLLAEHIEDIIQTFTTVDITRLRSLYLHNTPMKSLLKVAGPTIRDLKIRAYYSDIFLPETVDAVALETVDATALAGAHLLRSLDLQLPFLQTLNKLVHLFGSLVHLALLQTVNITVSQKTYPGPAEWLELDRLLGELPALRDVHVYSGEPHEEALLRSWMPVLAGRDVLRIRPSVPD
ncbi:hypothetical protein B0H15DRAFT_796652 [Mycena belliarum]|uniref:Uncharacterized protein n=1 Tax=Mycena belliarum TaxID=1033014 RepID=A0AAD6XU32_9AGAR|nr:hypothetical protein B0H15DRAFT_796652 [Mycena belliae]